MYSGGHLREVVECLTCLSMAKRVARWKRGLLAVATGGASELVRNKRVFQAVASGGASELVRRARKMPFEQKKKVGNVLANVMTGGLSGFAGKIIGRLKRRRK